MSCTKRQSLAAALLALALSSPAIAESPGDITWIANTPHGSSLLDDPLSHHDTDPSEDSKTILWPAPAASLPQCSGGFHDTWMQPLAAKIDGRHDGWSRIAGAYCGAEINLQFAATRGRSYEESLELPASVFIGSSDVSARALIEAAIAEGTAVVINADANIGWPYHADPSGRPDEAFYVNGEGFSASAYCQWVGFLAGRFPDGRATGRGPPVWIQLQNESAFQRGREVAPEAYAEIVRECASRVDPWRLIAGGGAGVVAERHAAAARAEGRQDLSAGRIAEISARAQAFDRVWTATAPKAVAFGYHHLILHRVFDPTTLAIAYREEALAIAAEFPDRRIWLDETLPVGNLPGGTTTALGGQLYAAALEALDQLLDEGTLEVAAIGFAGGLEPPCSDQWGVCAALIDERGDLTVGGRQVVESAKALGRWRGGDGGEGNAGEPVDLVKALEHLEKAESNAAAIVANVDQVDKLRGFEIMLENTRSSNKFRKLRSATRGLGNQPPRVLDRIGRAIAEIEGLGGVVINPPPSGALSSADVEALAWVAGNATAIAIRFESSGVFVDWRPPGWQPGQGHPSSGPHGSVAAAVAAYRAATGG